MKKRIKQLVVLTSILGVGGVIAKKIVASNKFKHLSIGHQRETGIPTVILHGVNGNKRTMQGMMQRLTNQNVAHKALEIEVAKDGQLFVNGSWGENKTDLNPIIQVFFDSNDESAEIQADWLKNVMIFLHDKLEINVVNLIGHSMGGVTSLHYLTLIKSFQDKVPIVAKLITLGSPFKGDVAHTFISHIYKLDSTDKGVRNFDGNFNYFMENQRSLPRELKILNIYGDIENGTMSDSIVAIDSALALGEIVNGFVESYDEKKLTGLMSQHTLLHENPEADKVIIEFLWKSA